MELWPAIDLRGGRAVRLRQGDYDRETVFDADPIDVARRFVAAGARRLHLVDLDGARDGLPRQADLVAGIAAAAGVPIQIGGGIRTPEAVRRYATLGVARFVVGSIAVERPELLADLATQWPGRVVLGLDARDGRVAVRGWRETTAVTVADVIGRHGGLPLAAVVFTDIATDGMLGGPNLASLAAVIGATPLPVVASGGIATAADIVAVARLGAAGCIVGRALYDGGLDLTAALGAAGDR